MKPIYIPEKCVFYLNGSNEKVGDYQLVQYYGSAKVNNDGILEATTETAAVVYTLKNNRIFDNNA